MIRQYAHRNKHSFPTRRSSDLTWVRGRGWALRTPIQGLPYYRESNPGFVTMGRHVLDLVLWGRDRKSTRLNSSHGYISYAVFCLKKKKKTTNMVNYHTISNEEI